MISFHTSEPAYPVLPYSTGWRVVLPRWRVLAGLFFGGAA